MISFRYSVVSGLNTNPLEPVYHYAAKAVIDGQARTPAEVFTLLKPLYVDDARMKQDFALMAIDTEGRWGKLTRYILARLESDASGRACDPDTIEHILPENPVDAWEESFPRGLWDESIYSLGNLTLLESATNRRLGNVGLPRKARGLCPEWLRFDPEHSRVRPGAVDTGVAGPAPAATRRACRASVASGFRVSSIPVATVPTKEHHGESA